MKATDPLHPIIEEGSVQGHRTLDTTPGIDLLTHMSIEFTKSNTFDSLEYHVKATICEEDAPFMEIDDLEGGKQRYPTYGEPYVEWYLRGNAKLAIMQAKELIKQLNEEK